MTIYYITFMVIGYTSMICCIIQPDPTLYKEQILEKLKEKPDILDTVTENPNLEKFLLHIMNETLMTNTRSSIQKLLQKAFRGENIQVVIIGESVTVGADLGVNNTALVYQHHLVEWWNKTFGQITGSLMEVRTVAVGGVSSVYFGRCWKEYLSLIEPFDFVMWEFNINDSSMKDIDVAISIERFIRSWFAKYHLMPSLFLVFYGRHKFNQTVYGHAENITSLMAHHHNVSCLSIEPLLVKGHFKEMFTKHHPSAVAHAQMAIAIIQLFRQVSLEVITQESLITIQERLPVILDNPLYVIEETDPPVCWNSVYPDFRDPSPIQHLMFSLPFKKTGSVDLIKDGWKDAEETRYDLTGGYKLNRIGDTISVKFPVISEMNWHQERSLSIAWRLDNITSNLTVYAVIRNGETRIFDNNITIPATNGLRESLLIDQSLKPGECELELTLFDKIPFLLSAIIIF